MHSSISANPQTKASIQMLSPQSKTHLSKLPHLQIPTAVKNQPFHNRGLVITRRRPDELPAGTRTRIGLVVGEVRLVR